MDIKVTISKDNGWTHVHLVEQSYSVSFKDDDQESINNFISEIDGNPTDAVLKTVVKEVIKTDPYLSNTIKDKPFVFTPAAAVAVDKTENG